MKYRETWYDKAVERLSISRIVIIQGLRRVGKTTVLKEIVKNSDSNFSKIIYYSFNTFGNDDDKFLKDLFEQLKTNESETLLAFDEFQEYEDWNKFFKSVYDFLPHVKIVATGSVSHNTTTTDNTEGGRYKIITMPTLSFDEYMKIFKKLDINKINEANFNEYASNGSYPAQDWVMSGLAEYKKQVSINIVEKIKDNKLLRRYKISKDGNVDSVLRYFIENVGQTISIYAISKGTGVQKETVTKIVEYLKDNHIIYRINNSAKGDSKGTSLDSKYYLGDHTFYLFAHEVSFNNLEDTYKSFIFENIIFNEMRRRKDKYSRHLFFYKKTKSKEITHDIDLAFGDANTKYVEVKHSHSVSCLTAGQKDFAKKNQLNIIYLGESKRIENKNYINVVEFLKGRETWI